MNQQDDISADQPAVLASLKQPTAVTAQVTFGDSGSTSAWLQPRPKAACITKSEQKCDVNETSVTGFLKSVDAAK
jgi:hypothetical protein